MDLEAYIEKKFISFKFPLIDKTEEEVKKVKSNLNARGLLHSGQFISLPYKIRQNSIETLTKEFLKLEIEIRVKNNIKFNEDMLKKIEDKLIKFVDHEFENLIYETKKEANLINFGDENFEKGFLPNILRDKNKIIDSLKNELEIKKYELLISAATLEVKKEEQKEYDAFLSHASEDKKIIADKLVKKLIGQGLKIWYDDFCIKPGDSIREKIDEGLLKSRHGLLLLSKNFFKKDWCKKELNALFLKNIDNIKNKIFPIWFGVNHDDVKNYSLLIADIKAFRLSEDNIDEIIKDIINNLKFGIDLTRVKRYKDSEIEEKLTYIEETSNNSQTTRSTIRPVIDSAADSLGNVNINSWAKGSGSDWSSGGIESSPTIYIGDTITFTINVSNTTNLHYRFQYQPSGGSFITIQDWSSSNICTWKIPKNAFGKWTIVNVQVRNIDGPNYLGFCDDYTYLTYIVFSR